MSSLYKSNTIDRSLCEAAAFCSLLMGNWAMIVDNIRNTLRICSGRMDNGASAIYAWLFMYLYIDMMSLWYVASTSFWVGVSVSRISMWLLCRRIRALLMCGRVLWTGYPLYVATWSSASATWFVFLLCSRALLCPLWMLLFIEKFRWGCFGVLLVVIFELEWFC